MTLTVLVSVLLFFVVLDVGDRFYRQYKITQERSKVKLTNKQILGSNGKTHLVNPIDLVSVSKIFELDPNKKYLFWWKQLLPDRESQFIQKSLQRLGLNFRIFMGPGAPNIYEVQSGGMQKISLESKKPVITEAPKKTDERREFNPAIDKPIQ